MRRKVLTYKYVLIGIKNLHKFNTYLNKCNFHQFTVIKSLLPISKLNNAFLA